MPGSSVIENLKIKLLLKRQTAHRRMLHKHPKVMRWLAEKGLYPGSLRQHSAALVTGISMASLMLVNSIHFPHLAMNLFGFPHGLYRSVATNQLDQGEQFVQQLQSMVSSHRGRLSKEEEKVVNELIYSIYGVQAVAELDGNRLNHQIGLMGKEQHLKRYPGDKLKNHIEQRDAGIAPGLSAWGYFADSKEVLTTEDILREKYYVAVQTLYLSNWNEDYFKLKEWYKYRKVVVVNPNNGKAVVAVIGDAGPHLRTGKVFGGSPEVMEKLQLGKKTNNGTVILLFLNDPDDRIPLGPLRYHSNVLPISV